MLQPKDWENDNIIAYTLTLSHAECLYLCNFRDEALKEFSKLLELPLSLHQKVCNFYHYFISCRVCLNWLFISI